MRAFSIPGRQLFQKPRAGDNEVIAPPQHRASQPHASNIKEALAMGNRLSTRPLPINTYIGLLPRARCVVVRHWKPSDAGTCGRCRQCVAQPAYHTDRFRDVPLVCVRFVPYSRLYAECFDT